MTNYGERVGFVGEAECWTVVIIMLQVIWRELRKVRIEANTLYGSDNQTDIVGKYLWVPYRHIV